ncbi:hypothetical protein CEXT_136331 [Caerostris extrusa]|uniref:Uncharacterized protein n=1 Tax=Caerostris extrusa TaxID=172846 RepID=A0AAV4SEW3_CAEEX|nr:hypothetical protein CEXT_136331 [Caerostris extrusa]
MGPARFHCATLLWLCGDDKDFSHGDGRVFFSLPLSPDDATPRRASSRREQHGCRPPATHAVEEMDASDIINDKQSAPLHFLHDDVFAKITLQNILEIIIYQVQLSDEALRQIAPENLRACVTSGQLHAIRSILKSRYLIDSMINDMNYQKRRLNLDTSDPVDNKNPAVRRRQYYRNPCLAASHDFITVKPTKRRRQNAPPIKPKITTQELTLHNKFSTLTVNNDVNYY